MAYEVFAVTKWWKKIVAVRVVTEEGVFVKDLVPTDYAGSELKVEVTQRLIVAEPGGNFTELNMDDVYGVMDQYRLSGVGAQINWDDGRGIETVITPTDSSAYELWEIRTNPLMDTYEQTAVSTLYEGYLVQAGKI